jgi:microcystin-dependent protein
MGPSIRPDEPSGHTWAGREEDVVADPFVAEIRIFPFNFAPKGWAWCDGQLLPLSQNTALFSLLGTTYGGNGKSNFALPDLQGRAPMHPGQGPGLSLHDLGETGGSETVSLLESEIPSHSHNALVVTDAGDLQAPSPARALARTGNGFGYVNTNPNGSLAAEALAPAGGDQPHNNLQPYLTFYFCIALQGVFPPRT